MQLFHDQVADEARLDFPLADRLQAVQDALDRLLDGLRRHRPLLQGAQHALAQLLTVEWLAAPVV